MNKSTWIRLALFLQKRVPASGNDCSIKLDSIKANFQWHIISRTIVPAHGNIQHFTGPPSVRQAAGERTSLSCDLTFVSFSILIVANVCIFLTNKVVEPLAQLFPAWLLQAIGVEAALVVLDHPAVRQAPLQVRPRASDIGVHCAGSVVVVVGALARLGEGGPQC